MARYKTPPKWAVPAYIVLAVMMGGVMVYRVVRGAGGNLFLPGVLFLVFGFNAYVNWRQRAKSAGSAQS